jgi:toxin CptA
MLKIAIGPSRRLALLLCLVHMAAVGACLVVTMPVSARVVLIAVIAASCARSVYGAALLRSRDAVVALEIKNDGALSFQTRRGEWYQGTLLGSSFVAPYLAVLNLRCESSRRIHHVVILPDSAATDAFRQLRIWMRWRTSLAGDKKF